MISRGAPEWGLEVLRIGCVGRPGVDTPGEPMVTRSKTGGEWQWSLRSGGRSSGHMGGAVG